MPRLLSKENILGRETKRLLASLNFTEDNNGFSMSDTMIQSLKDKKIKKQ
jgi:hypothetical protein